MSVYLTPPSPFDLYVQKSSKITCLVVDLASKDGVNIQWSRENEDLKNEVTTVYGPHFNKTFTVISTLPVAAEDWIEGMTYTCKVTHPHLPKAIVRSLPKAKGEPRKGWGWARPLTRAWAEPTPVHRQTCSP